MAANTTGGIVHEFCRGDIFYGQADRLEDRCRGTLRHLQSRKQLPGLSKDWGLGQDHIACFLEGGFA